MNDIAFMPLDNISQVLKSKDLDLKKFIKLNIIIINHMIITMINYKLISINFDVEKT